VILPLNPVESEIIVLPPPKGGERGVFYPFLETLELTAEFGYTTACCEDITREERAAMIP
jgi:hypothetical protein